MLNTFRNNKCIIRFSTTSITIPVFQQQNNITCFSTATILAVFQQQQQHHLFFKSNNTTCFSKTIPVFQRQQHLFFNNNTCFSIAIILPIRLADLKNYIIPGIISLRLENSIVLVVNFWYLIIEININNVKKDEQALAKAAP